tara:strand:+ start:197 stop:367 length:171 start_codon:yes stop_codon:yes gene_type:complete
MKDFYLAFVLSGFIGLIVGYLWGVVDGHSIMKDKASTVAKEAPRSPFDGSDDIPPA